jgi:hypothetical protein
VDKFDIDDMELKKAYERNEYGFMLTAKRDGVLVDAITSVSASHI